MMFLTIEHPFANFGSSGFLRVSRKCFLQYINCMKQLTSYVWKAFTRRPKTLKHLFVTKALANTIQTPFKRPLTVLDSKLSSVFIQLKSTTKPQFRRQLTVFWPDQALRKLLWEMRSFFRTQSHLYASTAYRILRLRLCPKHTNLETD